MVRFTALIKKFGDQGEKTGWTIIEIPAEIVSQLKPEHNNSFRVKGKLDKQSIEMISLLPMGGGVFIMPLNAQIRKAIGKNKGAMLNVQLSIDKRQFEISKELLECLADEPGALANFKKLPNSHQRYFSKWVTSGKSDSTRAKRIARAVNAMAKGWSYGEMLKS
ncbi:MAG: YdeI/OmpD-associated family protein [Flavitalea sp.]